MTTPPPPPTPGDAVSTQRGGAQGGAARGGNRLLHTSCSTDDITAPWGQGVCPLQLNCPSGVRPCAQAPTQVGSSPSSTPPSPSPHRHACLPPVTRALPETAAEHGHPKTEQRPWRKEITSDVWKPKCIKMVILGNFRTLLDVLIFMLWSIVVFVFSSPEGVHHSWKYCNTRSMRGVDRASSLF